LVETEEGDEEGMRKREGQGQEEEDEEEKEGDEWIQMIRLVPPLFPSPRNVPVPALRILLPPTFRVPPVYGNVCGGIHKWSQKEEGEGEEEVGENVRKEEGEGWVAFCRPWRGGREGREGGGEEGVLIWPG